MARPDVGTLLHHIQHLAGPCAPAGLSDRDLLARFADRRDEAAFVALVQRHGPLVLNVCRRLLRQEQDAEDVFQATFLVLARKAGSVRWRDSVAPWLHAVAHRLARKARADALRRDHREREAATGRPATTADDLSWREAVAILEEELGRLPERYRAPLLLCCWEGKARDEAARLLGWTAGTVKGRLERGRELLRSRLARRGVALSAGLLAVGLTRGAVPSALAGATVRLALAVIGGTAGAVPPAVVALAEGALGAAKLREAGVLLVALLMVAGAGAWGTHVWKARPPEESVAEAEPAAMPKDADPPAKELAAPPAPAEKPPEKSPDEKPPAPLPWPRHDRDGDPLPAGVARRFGTARLHQSDVVTAVAFSPDGKMLASAEERSGWVHLWDATTGKELHRFRIEGLALAFSRDGETLAVVGNAPTAGAGIYFWGTKDGEQVKGVAVPLKEKAKLDSPRLAFMSDGKRVCLLYKTGAEVFLWGRREPLLKLPPELRGAFALVPEIDPKSDCLAVGTPDAIHYLDLAGRRKFAALDKKPGAEFTALALGYGLVAGGAVNGEVRVWDLSGPRPPALLHPRLDAGGKVKALTISAAHGAIRLTGLSDSRKGLSVSTWETDKGKRLTHVELEGTPPRPSRIVLSPDGERVAILGDADQRVRLWDTTTGKELFPSIGHERAVSRVAFLPGGKSLLSIAADGVLRWPADSDDRPTRLPETHVRRDFVAVSRDGKLMATANSLGGVGLCDTDTGRLVREINTELPIWTLGFAPDGKSLALGTNKGVRLLSVPGCSLRRLGDEKFATAPLAFSPDGKLLVTNGRNATELALWDVSTGEQAGWLKAPDLAAGYPVAFHPAGTLLAVSGARGEVALLDIGTGRVLRLLPGAGLPVRCFAFVRGGRLLAAANGAVLTLWEVATGAEVLRLTGHDGAVNWVAASPDGNRLVTAGADTTVLLWDLAAAWKETAPKPPKGKEPPTPEGLWRDLSRDGAAAYRAVYALAADREKALSLAKNDLAPKGGGGDEVGPLVADLDSTDPKVRERAIQRLRRIGSPAEPALRKELAAAKSEKLRARLRGLLADLELSGAITPDADLVYAGRLVDLLDLIGTAEARKRLEELARDGRTWALRQAARVSLDGRPAP